MTLFILVRHGQTEWNRVERFRGLADVPLDALGLAQAAAAGQDIVARWQPAAIYHSPLRRAARTASTIGQATGLVAEPHDGLLDIDFGQWQGLTPSEAHERWPELVDAWYSRPGTVAIPGGERLTDVRARGMRAVLDLATSRADQTVVLVGHTVINRAILLGILGLDDDAFWRLGQDIGAINVFEFTAERSVLVTMNDTCHLRRAG